MTMINNFNEFEILLVEDNKTDRELIFWALKKHNLDKKVFAVKNGEEAIDYIFATNQYIERKVCPFPRVVILDLKLPKVNGIEVLKRIKSNERTRAIPVVVFTSSQGEKDRLESYNSGTNSFVTKPINFEKFIQVVSEIGLYWLFSNQ